MARSPFLVAIAGGSGSGKSTLAEALADQLGRDRTVLIQEDAYYRPLSDYGAPASEAERREIIAHINYDDPSAKNVQHLSNDLHLLKAGQGIEQPVYNFDTHDREPGKVHMIAPADVLIFEGIHTLSIPDIRKLIDLSVYVDTPDDLRLARRLRRDVLDRERTVESVLFQYLGTVRPAHYQFTHPAKFIADLVIADEGLPAYGHVSPSPEAIERMLAPVMERLKSRGVA